jgi:DNA-binding NarL/FixJ family response regulator
MTLPYSISCINTADSIVQAGKLFQQVVAVVRLNGVKDCALIEESIVRLAQNAFVIVIDEQETLESFYACFQLGARAYVPCSRGLREIIRAVQTVALGGVFVSNGVVAQPLTAKSEPIAEPKSPAFKKAVEGLTEKQKCVLMALASGRSNKEIAADLHMTENTVKVHIHNIMKRKYVHNRTQLALIAQSIVNC